MKSFLNSLIVVPVFFGAAFAQLPFPGVQCMIQTLDKRGYIFGFAGSNSLSVAEGSDDPNTSWFIPEVGSQGPIIHFKTGRKTFLGPGDTILAETNATAQTWKVASAGSDKITIQAVNQDKYWTDGGTPTIFASGSGGGVTQIFGLQCVAD